MTLKGQLQYYMKHKEKPPEEKPEYLDLKSEFANKHSKKQKEKNEASKRRHLLRDARDDNDWN